MDVTVPLKIKLECDVKILKVVCFAKKYVHAMKEVKLLKK